MCFWEFSLVNMMYHFILKKIKIAISINLFFIYAILLKITLFQI